MYRTRLWGEQYVQLAPGVAAAIAPYVGSEPQDIHELVMSLDMWPEQIRPAPIQGWGGRLIPGDPVLLDANDAGMYFEAGTAGRTPVFVRWSRVRRIEVLRRERSLGA